jgi:ubiquinone/menaquinone biosynthesis C-methylase UbiE
MTAVEIHHPFFAQIYRRVAAAAERKGAAEHRRELVNGLTGRVLEVGSGPGLNFKYYPASVRELIAVEPEPHLRELSRKTAEDAVTEVRVEPGVAEELPFEDGYFDAAVVSFVLCSVVDPAKAIGELFRVIRPGGELRFYEHVLSENPRLARFQHSFDPIWQQVAGGCHPDRATVRAIEESGFELERYRRFPFRPNLIFVPIAPHVLGIARRP